MQTYAALTDQGKVRRLRQLALKALQHYALDVKRVSLITNQFNGIFRIDTHDGQKWVMRIMLPLAGHTPETIRSEMMWLDALARETDLQVPAPLTTRDGAFSVAVEVEGVPEPRECVVFSWLSGKLISKHMTEPNMIKYGELHARLHQHAATFTLPPDFKVGTLNTIWAWDEPNVLFEPQHRHHFTDEQFALLQGVIPYAEAQYQKLYATAPDQPRVIHNDLHIWNVMVSRGKLAPIDFEDLMWGYPVQDIGTSLYYITDQPNDADILAWFRDGYSRHLDWVDEDLIPIFMAGRGLMLFNFVLYDPDDDLANYPGFLERIIERLQQVRDKMK